MSSSLCPLCGNMLMAESSASDGFRLSCRTCPYKRILQGRRAIRQRVEMRAKEKDDVMGGAAQWANADKTQVRCEMCKNELAYYYQMQTRSADEPMTTFYKCTKCGHNWKE